MSWILRYAAFHLLRQGNVIGTLGQTKHLSGDTDTALVQNLDGVLVALADLAKHVLLGDDNVIKVEDTCGGGTDTELNEIDSKKYTA